MLNHSEDSGADNSLLMYFITMDIETINPSGKLIPYLICAYDGLDYITSFGKDQKELFNNFINNLLSTYLSKERKLLVYAHNFSGFDGIFLMKHLINYGKVEPLLFNGRLISIKVKLNVKGYNNKIIVFKDSYLLLPLALRLLCKAFNITMPKGYFPFKLTNIFYSGVLPKFEYWTGISLDTYKSLVTEHKGKFWCFKLEAVKYCKLDCKCLHEVITKFNALIFGEFKINAHRALTLPSLAMKIYKTHFMPENSIYQLLGPIEQAIRQSYTGGAVDVYIPHNRITHFLSNVRTEFKNLFYYDVNSLYPTVMSKFLMPVGKPTYFEGDIRKIDPNAYGFFYCKMTSPDYLEHPILQRRIKTVNGLRTVAGLGTWSGWICSIEMDNAIKFGYQFEILHGYQFEQGDLFSDYINKMYSLRMEYEKGHPLNLIAKLLMNSLYGKFGMKMEVTRVDIYKILDEEDIITFREIIKSYGESIHDWVLLDNSYIVIRDSSVELEYNKDEDMYHGQDVNIAIASAVTASARVFMSSFKNNQLFKLFYTDTDSIVIDRPLPDEMIGNSLGQLKLEHTIKKAVFLAPKVYGLVTEDGAEVIKIKGITPEAVSSVHINELEHLLIQDSTKEFVQEKWYKNIVEGKISVADVAYTLKVTSNKRHPIYNEGIFDNTSPFNYNEIENH